MQTMWEVACLCNTIEAGDGGLKDITVLKHYHEIKYKLSIKVQDQSGGMVWFIVKLQF